MILVLKMFVLWCLCAIGGYLIVIASTLVKDERSLRRSKRPRGEGH